jgi:hypothetical protein
MRGHLLHDAQELQGKARPQQVLHKEMKGGRASPCFGGARSHAKLLKTLQTSHIHALPLLFSTSWCDHRQITPPGAHQPVIYSATLY